jgi:hypothetical protein
VSPWSAPDYICRLVLTRMYPSGPTDTTRWNECDTPKRRRQGVRLPLPPRVLSHTYLPPSIASGAITCLISPGEEFKLGGKDVKVSPNLSPIPPADDSHRPDRRRHVLRILHRSIWSSSTNCEFSTHAIEERNSRSPSRRQSPSCPSSPRSNPSSYASSAKRGTTGRDGGGE